MLIFRIPGEFSAGFSQMLRFLLIVFNHIVAVLLASACADSNCFSEAFTGTA